MVEITVDKPDEPPEVITVDGPGEVTIGRSGNCDCCLDHDPMVSRKHAVILVDPPSVKIRDLNSTNGLWINGEVYGASDHQSIIHPIELRNGDEIRVGLTFLRIRVEDPDLTLGPEWEILRSAVRPDNVPLEQAPDRETKDGMSTRILPRGNSREKERRIAAETVTDLAVVCPEIPGYVVERLVGGGRTGSVFKAGRSRDGESVALKIMNPAGAFGKSVVDDFLRVTERIRELDHPVLVRLHEAGEIGRRTFYTVSEFVNGENLAGYIERCPNRRLPRSLARELALQLVEGACYAHSRGVAHRDIHPGGIMLFDVVGRLKVKFTDIGMTHFWAMAGPGMTGAGTSDASRLGFTAPEELLQLGNAGMQADVFSLCAVYYHLLAGRSPYDFGSATSAMSAVENGKTIPLDRIMPKAPKSLIAVFERGLAAEPEKRFASACELLEALKPLGADE